LYKEIIEPTNKRLTHEYNSQINNKVYFGVVTESFMKDGHVAKEYFIEDGLHLSADGYIEFGVAVNKALWEMRK
jgi:lysophospholipase L1-like esterase